MDESPFLKQLVSSDRKARDSALNSLRTYLVSNTSLTPLDHLKLWKALFFAMWHSDRPLPQQKLARSLADLALALPNPSFLPFMRAFWTTMAREWTNIDALRMDKYLRLVRVYVNAGFEWLRRGKWDEGRVEEYLALIREWPLSLPAGSGDGQGNGEKVGDGLRYHVLDVWVDELENVDGEEAQAPLQVLMEPPRRLTKAKGAAKALKDRAKECVGDERLEHWGEAGAGAKESANDSDGEEEFVDLGAD